MKKISMIFGFIVIIAVTVVVVVIAITRNSGEPLPNGDDDITQPDPFEIVYRNTLCNRINATYVSTFTDNTGFAFFDDKYTYIDREGANILNREFTINLSEVFPENNPDDLDTGNIFILNTHVGNPIKTTRFQQFPQEEKISIPRFVNKYLLLKEGNNYNFYNSLGSRVNLQDLIFAENFTDKLALVRTARGFNYMKEDGTLLSKGFYKDAKTFQNGVGVVSDNVGYYLIDTQNKILNAVKYKSISLYKDGIAAAQRQNGTYTLIDEKGKELTTKNYDNIRNISEGFALALSRGVYTYLNKTGQELQIDIDLTKKGINIAYPFKNGFAIIQLKDNTTSTPFTFVDTKGKLVTQELLFDATDFYNGFAAVKIANEQWKFIDTSGNQLGQLEFKFAYPFRDDKIALVQDFDGKYYFINSSGTAITNNKFKDAYEFISGSAKVVDDNNEWSLVDTNLNVLTNNKYKFIGDFFNDIALVQKQNNKYTYINRAGDEITEEEFDSGFSFYEGLGKVDSTISKYITSTAQNFCNE